MRAQERPKVTRKDQYGCRVSESSRIGMSSQAALAERFRALHRSGRAFILPNAWDVPSARMFEELGFPAVATSSAGLMVSLGYPDGQYMPRVELISAVKKISSVLSVPLSADVVAGYGASPREVTESVKGFIDAGAVGVNIEDFEHSTRKLYPVTDQVEKIKELKQLSDTMGVPFVINARTDALRYAAGNEEQRFTECVARAKAYRDAGADCVYPMGLLETRSIQKFVAELQFPTNVMVRKGLADFNTLEQLGVRRVSFGPSASYAVFGFLRRVCKKVIETGDFSALTDGAITYEELNALAKRKA